MFHLDSPPVLQPAAGKAQQRLNVLNLSLPYLNSKGVGGGGQSISNSNWLPPTQGDSAAGCANTTALMRTIITPSISYGAMINAPTLLTSLT